MAGSIIFAGWRDCAPHLQQVLANCARLATTTEKAFFLFAENDLADSTKAILANWCEGRVNAHILCSTGFTHIFQTHGAHRLLRYQILDSSGSRASRTMTLCAYWTSTR